MNRTTKNNFSNGISAVERKCNTDFLFGECKDNFLSSPKQLCRNRKTFEYVKITITLLFLMMLSTMLLAQAGTTQPAQPSNYGQPGVGTEAIPYHISNLEDLRLMSEQQSEWWIENSTPGLNFSLILNGTAYSVSRGTANDTHIEIPAEYNGLPVTQIASSGFFGFTTMTSISIPNSVTTIRGSAFAYCTGLTSIDIPDSVTYIDGSAFSYCTGLTSVTIGNGVTSIVTWTFRGCTGLTSVTIGNSLTIIAYGAFYGCTSLTSINIPDSVTSIGEEAFYSCSSLSSIYIPNSVTNIGQSAFSGCTGLTSVTIGNSMTSIGNWAFRGCTGLTSIIIPNSVTNIGINPFARCFNLETITVSIENIHFRSEGNSLIRNSDNVLISGTKNSIIPNSITSIGNWAFDNCTGLTSIDIPDSVTSIGYYAFSGCTGLTSIDIPNSVTSFGIGAFAGCTSLTSINIPDSVTSIGAEAFYSCSSLSSINIPNSVTSIGDSAFRGCSSLTSINIPNSLTNIDYGMFLGCYSLTSIIIPNSVTSIGDSAFSQCAGLTSIYIPNSVTSIGYVAFSGCNNLTIYAEATSQPSGWDTDWNPQNRPVIWGATFTPPTNLITNIFGNDVTLNWYGAIGYALQGYNIYRGSTLLTTTPIIETNYTAINTPSGMHTFGVRAVYPFGVSEPVESIAYVGFNPPTELAASQIASSVNLSWIAPNIQNTVFLAGYRVERRDGVGSWNTILDNLSLTPTAWTDNTVIIGTAYEYRVIAKYTNPIYESVPSNEVTIMIIETVPNAAINPNPIHNATMIPLTQVLSWSPNVGNALVGDETGGLSDLIAERINQFPTGAERINAFHTEAEQINQLSVGTERMNAFPTVAEQINAFPTRAERINAFPTDDGNDRSVPTGYKIHFGTTYPPPLVQSNWTSISWNPSTAGMPLVHGMTYYWQIIPFNASGDAVGCPIWSFTTIPAPAFSINPTSHNFGEIIIGQTSPTQTFTITNTGVSPLIISSITISGATGYNLLNVGSLPWTPIAAGGNRSFQVSFSPTTIGYQWSNIVINDNTQMPPPSPPATQASRGGQNEYHLSESSEVIASSLAIGTTMGRVSYPNSERRTSNSERTTHQVFLEGTGIPPIPNPAINPNPINNATMVQLSQVLSWSANTTGSTPTGYKIHFGTTNPPALVQSNWTSTTWTPTPALLHGTTYYWQIIPFNSTGDAVGCPIWSFTTMPAVPNPAINPIPTNNATMVLLSQVLIWSQNTSGSSPTGFKIHFGTSNPPALVESNWTSATWNPSTAGMPLLHGTTYYWQIIPFNATGDAIGCPIWTFNTIPSVPNPAINPNPPNNAINVPLNQILSWDADVSKNSPPHSPPLILHEGGDTEQINNIPTGYKIHFGTTNPPPLVQSNWISTTWTHTPALQNGTTYYWQIVPFNTTGDAVGCPIWTFNTIPSVPNPAINPNPAHTSTNVPLTQTLSWEPNNSGGTPSGYKIHFGTTNPPPLVQNNWEQTSWNPVTAGMPMLHGVTYYWQIVPYNISGDALGCPVWSFITIPPIPDPAMYPNPTHASTNILLSQVISWSPNTTGGTPTGYKIHFGTTNPPALVESNWTTTTWTPALQYGLIYYWQIIPFNTTGDAVGCPVWSFTTALAPAFSISPTSHNFGSITVGQTSAPQTFTITNTGEGSLIIETISINNTPPSPPHSFFMGGAEQNEFNLTVYDLPWTLESNISRQFTVSFTPQAPAGSKSANLNITHNAAGSPHTGVVLTGDSVVSEGDVVILPTELLGNFPNPFNPFTSISFNTAVDGVVSIEIFDIRGSKVRTLADRVFTAGQHQVEWEGLDDIGRELGSGVYLYRMRTEGYVGVRRMVLLK